MRATGSRLRADPQLRWRVPAKAIAVSPEHLETAHLEVERLDPEHLDPEHWARQSRRRAEWEVALVAASLDAAPRRYRRQPDAALLAPASLAAAALAAASADRLDRRNRRCQID